MSHRFLLALATAGALLTFTAPVGLVSPAYAAPAPAQSVAEYQLIEAAYGGQLTRVRQLLAQGVKVDAQDAYGYTPLMWAAQAGWPLTTDVLIKKGAMVDARDHQGRTALLLATVRKHTEVVRVLLAAGANPKAPDHQGVTPADYARAKSLSTIAGMLAMATGSKPAVTVRTATKTPTPVVRQATPARPRSTPAPHYATPAPRALATPAAATGAIALSAGFRSEIGRLYGLYTEHLELRNPESLNQKGYNIELEEKLEQIFHTLNYGSATTLPRNKLQEARTWIVAARQRANTLGGNVQVYTQILESLEQRLAETGF